MVLQDHPRWQGSQGSAHQAPPELPEGEASVVGGQSSPLPGGPLTHGPVMPDFRSVRQSVNKHQQSTHCSVIQ